MTAEEGRLLELIREFQERAQTCIKLGAPPGNFVILRGRA
jgi:hypothetical protein